MLPQLAVCFLWFFYRWINTLQKKWQKEQNKKEQHNDRNTTQNQRKQTIKQLANFSISYLLHTYLPTKRMIADSLLLRTTSTYENTPWWCKCTSHVSQMEKNNTTLASCNVFARPVQYSLQLQPSFRRPSKCLLSCWSRNKVTVWKCYDFELQAKKNGRGNDLRLVHRSTVTSLNKIKNRLWATGFW